MTQTNNVCIVAAILMNGGQRTEKEAAETAVKLAAECSLALDRAEEILDAPAEEEVPVVRTETKITYLEPDPE